MSVPADALLAARGSSSYGASPAWRSCCWHGCLVVAPPSAAAIVTAAGDGAGWRRAGLVAVVVSEQWDEHLGVGASQASYRVPAGCRPVALERLGGKRHGVVPLRYVVEGPVIGGAAADAVDRKSTRLNSSHRCISY